MKTLSFLFALAALLLPSCTWLPAYQQFIAPYALATPGSVSLSYTYHIPPIEPIPSL